MNTRYDSQALSHDGVARVREMKGAAERLAALLEEVPCRETSVALTHLQTAVMFGVRAMSLNFKEAA